MNNKNYFIFAAAIALASCSVDEYMGENPEFTQTTKENIIGFGGGTGSMSRATQNTGNPEVMLDKHFKVYGCKSTSTQGTYQTVFNNYWVWYEEAKTTSNSNKWEYVGDKDKSINGNDGSVGILPTAQYIKYWDYSANHYRFVAGTPQNQVEFNVDNTSKNVTGATVTGLAGHINPNASGTSMSTNPVYISAPIQITKNSTPTKYGEAVKLDFTRLQTKVRVGIYETIPGYKIKSIEFYKQGTNGLEAETDESKKNNNVTLTYKPTSTTTSTTTNYFQGGSDVKATVTYEWDATPKPTYTVEYQAGTLGNLETDNNWYGGKFTGVPAESSNPTGKNAISDLYGSDTDMDGNTGYFIVLPTPTETEASALTLKCDYVLESLDDTYKEKITVKGATAAIPAAYCKWEPNKMYTYIFKISQETNGTTGTPGTDDPAGLFPITFDAAAIAETDAKEGYETIINSPSITTYQDGSVTANGIEYKTGTAIYITVMQDGNLQTLNSSDNTVGCVKVYNLGETNAKTEADLTVNAPTSTVGTVELDKLNDTDTDMTKATFIPSAAGYYAIQYCYDNTKNPIAFKYKVIEVK